MRKSDRSIKQRLSLVAMVIPRAIVAAARSLVGGLHLKEINHGEKDTVVVRISILLVWFYKNELLAIASIFISSSLLHYSSCIHSFILFPSHTHHTLTNAFPLSILSTSLRVSLAKDATSAVKPVDAVPSFKRSASTKWVVPHP